LGVGVEPEPLEVLEPDEPVVEPGVVVEVPEPGSVDGMLEPDGGLPVSDGEVEPPVERVLGEPVVPVLGEPIVLGVVE
jgi:hypothetical protein